MTDTQASTDTYVLVPVALILVHTLLAGVVVIILFLINFFVFCFNSFSSEELFQPISSINPT